MIKSVVRFLVLSALLLVCGRVDARFPHGFVAAPGFVSQLALGGGGWCVEGDIANDGQVICITDTYGAWLRPPGSTTFRQIVNCNAMPTENCGYFPRTGDPQILQSVGPPASVAACPQNSAIIYMEYNGFAFKSINHAVTWTKLSGFNSGVAVSEALNGTYRLNGRKSACDPNNDLHAYIGTDVDGLFETNDGGTTWSKVSSGSIPTTTSDGSACGSSATICSPGYNIAFDAHSAHNCGASSLNTCIIYVANFTVSLTGHLYGSTNGGTSWTAATGGPNKFAHVVVSPFDGVVWLTDWTTDSQEGVAWQYSGGGSGGTFTALTSLLGETDIHSIAVDPGTSGHIVAVTSGGRPFYSINNGVGWSVRLNVVRVATDAPWLAVTQENFMSNGDTIFDPSQSNELIFFEGIGVWQAGIPLTGTATVTWNSITNGIEELDSQFIKALPSGKVLVGVQDRGFFLLTPGTFPSLQNTPYQTGVAIAVGSAGDYAKNNSNYVAGIVAQWGVGQGYNGFSTDGGVNWQPYNTFFTTFLGTAVAVDGSNQWKITLSSSDVAQLTSWTTGAGGSSGDILRLIGLAGNGVNTGLNKGSFPVQINDATHVTLLGSIDSNTVLVLNSADGFILERDTNPVTDANGAFAITNVANNGSGAIRLTLAHNVDGRFTTLSKVCITGSFGVSQAIGCWKPSAIGTNTVDLQGSSFAGTYTSGGLLKTLPPAGGSIAVASDTNTMMIPMDNSFPQCTTDGGNTWSELKFPASQIGSQQETGYGQARFLVRHIAVADPDPIAAANTIYAYNYLVGVYKFVNCGTPTIVSNGGVATTNFFGPGTGGQFNSTLSAVPGHTGHLFFSAGTQGAPPQGPSSVNLKKSQDGGATWTNVPNVLGPNDISCGAVAPGKTYPTCFLLGWVDQGSGFTYGIWRSTNADQSTPAWTFITDYPNGNQDLAYMIEADQVIWNQWYIGFSGSGFGWGRQN